MVELRWIKRERPIDAFVVEGSISRTYPVLQFRTRTNPLEYDLHPPIWSEWQDVPLDTTGAKK